MVKVIVLLFVCLALAAFATANPVSHVESPQPETNTTIREHIAMNDLQTLREDCSGQTYNIYNYGYGNVNYVTINNYCSRCPYRNQIFVQEQIVMYNQQACNIYDQGYGNVNSVSVKYHNCNQGHVTMNDQQMFWGGNYKPICNIVNRGNGNVNYVTINYYCNQ